ncbi:MAG TPA: hypothetical protein VMP11_01775 [Verrucomicrobiae bacterium]|nr:hypothetical protein [Verrucomicrobiae bacterium]
MRTLANRIWAGTVVVLAICLASPVVARAGGYVDVTNYGVVCDGTTDNNPSATGPLQTAINAGSDIHVPASCAGKIIKFSTGVTLGDTARFICNAAPCVGLSPTNQCITLQYTGTGTAFTANPGNGNALENCALSTTSATSGTGVRWNVNGGQIYGNLITGFGIGLDMSDGSSGGTQDNHVQRNSIGTSSSGSVSTCSGSGKSGIGIKLCGAHANHGANNNYIVNNQITGAQVGVDCEDIASECEHNVFTDNDVLLNGSNVTFFTFSGVGNVSSFDWLESGGVTGTSYGYDTTGGSGKNTIQSPEQGIVGATAVFHVKSNDFVNDPLDQLYQNPSAHQTWTAFIDGNVGSNGTDWGSWTPSGNITVTSVEVVLETTAASGCSPLPIVRLTDGTNNVDVSIGNGVWRTSSGTISQTYSAGNLLEINTVAGSCGTDPRNAMVTVQYYPSL